MMYYGKAFEEAVKQGVDQAMKDYELTIGMTLKEAVEKQIPKRPIDVYDHYLAETNDYDYTSFNCPYCGEELTFDEYHQPKFCPNCGQKLDWRENNDSEGERREENDTI